MATKLPAAMDTAEASNAEPPQLTLRDLDHLMNTRFASSHAFQLFDACNAETQRKLSRELLGEYMRLLQLPAADRMLTTRGRIHLCHSSDGDESSDSGEDNEAELAEIDIFADPYEVKHYFLDRWINGDPDMNELAHCINTTDFEDTSRDVQWDAYKLYTTPGTRGYSHNGDGGSIPNGSESCSPWSLISSQLLLYRLIAVFGPPPLSDKEQIDGYKSAWAYTLYWIPDLVDNQKGGKVFTSSLCFADYKGAFTFHFTGSEEASKTALLLLEWLVSDNVPHTYDGVLVGNRA